MNKVKLSVIDPHIQRPYENPLDKLLTVDLEFEKNNKKSKVVSDLIDYAFGKNENENVTEETVIKELTKNPRLDHAWYRMIQMSKKYKTQKQVNKITDIIHQIALKFWN